MSHQSSKAFTVNQPAGRVAFVSRYIAATIDLSASGGGAQPPGPPPLCSYDETISNDALSLSGQCEVTVDSACTLVLVFSMTFNSACSSQFDYTSDFGSDSQVVDGSAANAGSFNISVDAAGTYIISFQGQQIPGPASPDPTSLRMVVTISLA